jgi:hypothetical protein
VEEDEDVIKIRKTISSKKDDKREIEEELKSFKREAGEKSGRELRLGLTSQNKVILSSNVCRLYKF